MSEKQSSQKLVQAVLKQLESSVEKQGMKIVPKEKEEQNDQKIIDEVNSDDMYKKD